MVIGSTIIPLSDFLTLSTSISLPFDAHVPVDDSNSAFLGQADRRRDSVTVSIAALMIGIFKLMLLVSRDEVSTSRGRMSDSAEPAASRQKSVLQQYGHLAWGPPFTVDR